MLVAVTLPCNLVTVCCHGQRFRVIFVHLVYRERKFTMSAAGNGIITRDDIIALEARCLEQIREDVLYAVRNDAKLRAVLTSKNYDDFK